MTDNGYRWMRILNRNVVQTSEEFYSIRLELSPAGPELVNVTDARAIITWPNDNDDATGYMHFLNDGDNFHGGDPPLPLVGPLAYIGSAANRTGIGITADNIVDIHFHCDNNTAGAGETSWTAIARILINGVTVAQDQTTTAYNGFPALFSTGFTLDLTDVTVREGDVIEGWYQVINGSTPMTEPGIPAFSGTGNNQLLVTAGSYT